MQPGIRISALTSLAQVTTTDMMPINSGTAGGSFTFQANVAQIAPVRSVNGQTGDVTFPLVAGNVNYLNANGTGGLGSLQTRIDAEPTYLRTWMTSADGTDLSPAVERLRAAGLITSGLDLRLPRGQWTASAGQNNGSYFFALTSCSGVSITGHGRKLTYIKANPFTNLGFANCVSLNAARIGGFTFDADRDNQTIPIRGIHGIRGNGMSDVIIEDADMVAPLGYGFGAQAGTFTNVQFRRCTIDRPGADGIDFKNPNANNSGCRISEIEVINWSRTDPSIGKAAIDVRGPVIVENCITRWTDVSSSVIATNHASYRARPDQRPTMVYNNSSPGRPEEGDLVFSVSSGGASSVVRAVSGSASLTVGGLALEDVVGTFIPGAQVSIGANSATIASFVLASDNGGGGTVFSNCVAMGPTTTAIGVGFVLLDTNIRVFGGIVRNQKTGISLQGGGVEAQIFGVEIADVSVGIDVVANSARIYGGSIRRASEAGIDILGAQNVVVDGMTFTSCTRGIRRNVNSFNASIDNLRFIDCSARQTNFDWGDQPSTLPRTASRSGSIFSILPTTSYSAITTVSGGAGGAANSRIFFFPLPLFNTVLVPQFFGTVVGTPAPGVSMKMGLYRDLGDGPEGSALLYASTSALSLSSAADTQQRALVPTSATTEAGLYWLAGITNGNAVPYTVPVSGNMGEWARYVGVNSATALLTGVGAQCRVASVSLFDYDLGLPDICPEVAFENGAPGSPFLFLQG